MYILEMYIISERNIHIHKSMIYIHTSLFVDSIKEWFGFAPHNVNCFFHRFIYINISNISNIYIYLHRHTSYRWWKYTRSHVIDIPLCPRHTVCSPTDEHKWKGNNLRKKRKMYFSRYHSILKQLFQLSRTLKNIYLSHYVTSNIVVTITFNSKTSN